MELDTISIGDIVKLSLKDSYKLFTVVRYSEDSINNEKMKEKYDSVRFGISMKFDIYYIITNNFNVKLKDNKIVINKDKFNLDEYYTEMEMRESMLKETIISNIEKINSLSPDLD